jgi:hypothetical protein
MPNRKTRNRMKNRKHPKRSSLNASAPSFHVLHANAPSFHVLNANAPKYQALREPTLHYNDTIFKEDDEMEFDNLSRAIVEERKKHTKKSRGGKKNKRKTRKMRR